MHLSVVLSFIGCIITYQTYYLSVLASHIISFVKKKHKNLHLQFAFMIRSLRGKLTMTSKQFLMHELVLNPPADAPSTSFPSRCILQFDAHSKTTMDSTSQRLRKYQHRNYIKNVCTYKPHLSTSFQPLLPSTSLSRLRMFSNRFF